MFNRILVPLDGSTLAEQAISHAEQFARIFESDIVLLQVLDPVAYHENPNSVDPLSWQIRKTESDVYMSGVSARIRRNLGQIEKNSKSDRNKGNDIGDKRVTYFIREGKAAENIVNFAHTENIDLLIICTHGAGGLSRWNISSITQKVINLVYLPVLIIRANNQPAREQTTIRYRRILLPIDCSRRAECALSAGIALASEKNLPETIPDLNSSSSSAVSGPIDSQPARLVLAAVIKPPELPIPEPYPVEIGRLSEQLMLASRKAVNNYLNEMKERLPVECEITVVENDSISTAIHQLANQEGDVDLVLLCAHGHTGQSTWPYGTVARNYMEHGAKPVLVIQDVLLSQVRPSTAGMADQASKGR